MKIFNRSVWCLLTVFFGILLVIAVVGSVMANTYAANLNGLLGIDPYNRIDVEGEDGGDTEYYKSEFYKADGSYDDKAMRANSLKVSQEVACEGSVLLWNNDALPLAKTAKVSLFGISAVDYLYGGSGSGFIQVTTAETLKSALEKKGVSVNAKLWNAYKLNRTSYGRSTATLTDIDPNYAEFKVGEVPWSALDSTTLGNATATIPSYGDAAVMVISRNGSENGDTAFSTSECLDNSYMDLAKEEAATLERLKGLKEAGKIKKIVLLINTANAMQFKNIVNYGVDACMWVGMGGNASLGQLADLLVGDADPSGHLVDAYAYDVDSAPANENFGNFVFTSYGKLPATQTYTHNTKYVVYQEGIYVGYRYYETRYEDAVIGGRNATSAAGVKAGAGDWNYKSEVAFPFGYGSGYTTFEHSGYTVKREGDDYKVSMTIRNAGTKHAGKDVMQVYLQKPYTDYDRDNGIEKAAVELVGFAKTKELAPGESQTLTVTVEGEDFKTYDAYGKKTYILEKGDYYLAAGNDAHDALNNVLAAKGYTTADGMDAAGNPAFAFKVDVAADDYEKYAVSSDTGNPITNQFDNADINLYEGTKDQSITYLSRRDWQATYPSAYKMSCTTEIMLRDMQYGYDPAEREGDEMPLYDTVGQYGELTLAMLKETEDGKPIAYGDPLWDELLNQMSWEEQNLMCTYGSNAIAGAESVAAPGAKVKDGPGGIGIANKNLDSLMAFPTEVLMASTWNEELVERLGNAFGMEILHVGYTGIYGPGANIHRSAYSGRTWEYYSEDGFMSGKMFAAETRGLQNRGVIVFTKHFLLNEQEWNRYGGTVWANEQTIREIYLKGFEAGVTEGHANGLMSSFNRIGCIWSGKHRGLMTEVTRNEWGFVGLIETDAGVGTHMLDAKAMAEAVVAGQDLWMSGGSDAAFNGYKNNATVCLAIRESCHRILYTQLHSSAMNGVDINARFEKVVPWWQAALIAGISVAAVVTALCLAMAVLSYVLPGLRRKKEYAV